MCNLLLSDPTNNIWSLGCNDVGALQTSLTAFTFAIQPPIFKDGAGKNWKLSATSVGRVVAAPTGPSQLAVSYGVLQTPSSFIYQLNINSFGELYTTLVSGVPPLTNIPTQANISMSRWPDTAGIICPRCNGATVSVSADLSCWCCTCSSFLDPEDTTVLVVLEE